jgi:gamma-glutamylcyclotransferase (GGCT)/AIG2-like uncharacterized protein YtfP
MTVRLFAYGTLQVGHEASGRLEVLAAVPGTIEGYRLYDTGLGWPFAAPGPPNEIVHGQILTLAGDDTSEDTIDAVLARADEWEGYDPGDPEGSPYLRERVSATATRSGRRLEVLVYVSSEERLVPHYRDLAPRHLARGVWTAD